MTFIRAFDRLSLDDQSFQVDGPWRGHFELDGHLAHCTLHSDDWLHLVVPLGGSAKALVARQDHLLLPIKVVPGPTLIAELPLVEDLDSTFRILRKFLRRGLAICAATEEPRRLELEDANTGAAWQSALEASAIAWHRDNEQFAASAGRARVIACAVDGAVVFRVDVTRLHTAAAVSLDALTDFVLAVNARFRFVRATLTPGWLVHEVALPTSVLTPELVSCAVTAVRDCFHQTRKACAALVDPRVAAEYLDFHNYRRDLYADTHH
jgi:hypothetical protein